jgi:hypothetical protein
VSGGALTVVVKDLKIGNKVSMVQVDLQTKGNDWKLVTRVTSLVTQGNLVTEKGVAGKKSSNYKDSLPRKVSDRVLKVLCPITLKYFAQSQSSTLEGAWRLAPLCLFALETDLNRKSLTIHYPGVF